jgi:hypothetical protein
VTAPRVVGVRPWFPWPLCRWRWWTEPVPAERLAALRIGLAAVLLGDILATYWPHARDFFGRGSLYGPELFPSPGEAGDWLGSLLRDAGGPALHAAMAAWSLATAGLLVGFLTRPCAAVTWALSAAVANLNPLIDNAGDSVRGIVLFYLVLCPCGATWSVDAWLRRRRWGPGPKVILVWPWPLRLLFVQMVCIYFCNGVHKASGRDWPAGDSLYYVLADLTLARWSYAQVPVPCALTRVLTWLVLGWEVSFPLLVLWRPLRVVALWFGAAFHLGIWASLELGGFAPYMLCLYLPLVPWERWRGREPDAPPFFSQGT